MAKLPVHEVRRLVLPLETAVDAVLDLDSEQGGALAFGPIVDARIESGPQPGLSVAAQRRGTGGAERRTFELPMLAAAFIRYCWKCRIPLPRSGIKRIEVGPEGFVFTIEGTIEVVRRHAALPKLGPALPEAAVDAPASMAAEPLSAADSVSAAELVSAAESAPRAAPTSAPAPESALARAAEPTFEPELEEAAEAVAS